MSLKFHCLPKGWRPLPEVYPTKWHAFYFCANCKALRNMALAGCSTTFPVDKAWTADPATALANLPTQHLPHIVTHSLCIEAQQVSSRTRPCILASYAQSVVHAASAPMQPKTRRMSPPICNSTRGACCPPGAPHACMGWLSSCTTAVGSAATGGHCGPTPSPTRGARRPHSGPGLPGGRRARLPAGTPPPRVGVPARARARLLSCRALCRYDGGGS